MKPSWLETDVLAENEKKFGKDHYSQFNEIENAISMLDFFDHNTKKKEFYKSSKDTYWGMKWDELKSLLNENGFQLVLLDHFKNTGSNYRIEEFCMWANKEKGLLIKATSYGDSINEGTCYGQATKKEGYDKFFPISASCGYDNGVAYWDKDIREGLLINLIEIEDKMDLLPIWSNKNVFLWLLDYEQTKNDKYDRDKINHERLSRCPKWVQEMVGFKK